MTSDMKCEGFRMPVLTDQGGPMKDSRGACCETMTVKLHKEYRIYHTRHRLANFIIVAEELWWQVMDYTRLNYNTISFFNLMKPETAASRWNYISLNTSKVNDSPKY